MFSEWGLIVNEILTTPPESKQQVSRAGFKALTERLPTGWKLVERNKEQLGPHTVDSIWRLTDPTGTSIELIVEAKRAIERRDLRRIRDRVKNIVDDSKNESEGLVIGRYLSPQVRADLIGLGLSYADAAGNIRIEFERPAIFISDRVTDKDPWRGPGRPRGSLKGEPAARVVRALIDFQGPMTISQLVELSGASTGATYRVRDYLLEAGLLNKLPDGTYRVPDWEKLLREWAADSASASVFTQTFIAPRGLQSLREKMIAAEGLQYAVTGSLAAEEWAPYAPTKLARIYIQDIDAAANLLDLRPTDIEQNVLLIEPKDSRSSVFKNPWLARDGATLVAPSQVAVDLLNGPGRNPAEGEELISWMAANENAWRK